ncbi:MAG: methionine--tRNA ligase [Firmicutes bacterium]|nr:methionine--tRNA ligase [Bacillota bacterium]
MDKKSTKKKNEKTYYITTPIYYPSGQWHIGHCYTSINCDALARYYKLHGYEVLYSTGTDEHGQKIAKVASEKGKTCQAHVDERAQSIVDLWKQCGVEYDRFIRTTDPNHEKRVQQIFEKLYKKGDIYKGKYSGQYCTPCESFWTDSQLVEQKCPDCGREVAPTEEECYYFALGKYSDNILKLLTETDFLEPKSRVNEMVTFIREGLQDLAVTRTSVEWGVSVPFDPKHSIYVWIDALSNYITLLGYEPNQKKQSADFEKFWPANMHMVGKEIVRFHAIIWPALLMALELPLPKKVYGHGWLLMGGDKMSKSKGNIVDPLQLIEKYGIDAFRYYLLSEVQFGSDGTYTTELYLQRTNTDLVNSYGNLVRRTFSMAEQYFGSVVSHSGEADSLDDAFLELVAHTPSLLDREMTALNLSGALKRIFELIGASNKYIDDTKPWALAKEETSKPRLMRVIFNLLESIRVVSGLLLPFLSVGPQKVLQAMDTKFGTSALHAKLIVLNAKSDYKLSPLEMLYPRIDIEKELKSIAK